MDRRKNQDRRRSGPTPKFPFRDSDGTWVVQDRRMTASRRYSDFQLEPLWRMVLKRTG